MYGIPDESLNMIMKTIASLPEIQEAVLYGSRAMGNHKNGSDIDIAVAGKNLSPDTVLRLSTLLNEELPLPYYFDVTDLSRLEHRELAEHIEKHGKVIFRR